MYWLRWHYHVKDISGAPYKIKKKEKKKRKTKQQNRWQSVVADYWPKTRPKWMLKFMLKPCCRNLFKIADLFCHLTLSFNRTSRLQTPQSWLKTGLLPTAVNSLVKMNGLRTRRASTLWTTMSGQLCLNATSHFNPSRRWSMSSRKFCSWYGTSWHRTRSTKPYWASRKDFGLCESWQWTLR